MKQKIRKKSDFKKFSYPITVVLTQLGEIPVPIPNTEVKPHLVDDTGMISAGKVD